MLVDSIEEDYLRVIGKRQKNLRDSPGIKRVKACPSRNCFSGASHGTDRVPQNPFHSYGGCLEGRIAASVHGAYRPGARARWSNAGHARAGVVRVVHPQRTARTRQRPRVRRCLSSAGPPAGRGAPAWAARRYPCDCRWAKPDEPAVS
ncbi:hypothetical protein [Polaromonas sp. CG9_12]|nr:hypothetical protein [Polaromonas sp. CG9_12]